MSQDYESTESVLDPGEMLPILAYAFRFAAKDCLQAAGLPDNPVARRQPYEGEQFERLRVFYKQDEVCLTTKVTMRVSKARSKCSGVIDLDAAVEMLCQTASLKCAGYFAEPGNTVGACNFPDEKSKKSAGFRWNGLIIKMAFRAETGLRAPQPHDPTFPRDPMEPFAESQSDLD